MPQQFWTILISVLGTGGIGGIILWVRFRRKDTADVGKTNAEAKKIDAEAENTLADGFKKLLAIQEAEILKRISQLDELEKIYFEKSMWHQMLTAFPETCPVPVLVEYFDLYLV